MEPEDLDLLYSIENDPDVWDVGVSNVPYSRYVLRDFIAQSSGDAYTDGQVRLIVETVEGGEVVGVADLVNYSPKHCRAEVGIVIECRHRRRGYAAEAVDLLADYAQRILHLHQLYAVVAERNDSALRLFTGRGFVRAASLPDWLYDGHGYHAAILLQRVLNSEEVRGGR